MPHGDIYIPEAINTKAALYEHVHSLLESLLADQRSWITNLSNAASLLYHCFIAYPDAYGVVASGHPVVNWSGFYLDSIVFPATKSQPTPRPDLLLLGPFHGRPACQEIRTKPARGVCAGAYVQRETLIVPDVEAYPGHIACDGETKSEIVVPLILPDGRAVGVLDLDSVQLGTFDEEDKKGLEMIAELVVRSCDWE